MLGNRDDVGMRPVALSGRVPTKVNLENGPIKIGDRVALSSIAGAGKKAGMFDDSVGIALDNFDGTSGNTVMVFVNLERGVDVNAIALRLLGNNATTELFGFDASSTMNTAQAGPLDFVGGMMSAIAKRIMVFSMDTESSSSSVATSTLAAAGSSQTQVDGFAQSLLKSITNTVMKMLADASNGIGNVFARAFHAKEEICVDDQCLSRNDIKAVLEMARTPGTSQSQNTANSSGSVNNATVSGDQTGTTTPVVTNSASDTTQTVSNPAANENAAAAATSDTPVTDAPVSAEGAPVPEPVATIDAPSSVVATSNGSAPATP